MSASWSKFLLSPLLLAPLGVGSAEAGGHAPSPPHHGEASALAGHDAEAKARDPADDSRREALFFTPAAREIGTPGVDCGHRVGRRPEAIAGLGAVVVVIDRGSGLPVLRRWFPPEPTAPDRSPDLQKLREDVATELGIKPSADLPQGRIAIEATAFAWCR